MSSGIDRSTTPDASPEVAVVPGRSAKAIVLDLLRNYGILVFLAALFIGLSLSSSAFLNSANLKHVVDQSVAIGLLACAGTLVMIAGGFDLSAGGIYATCAVVGAKLINADGIAVAMILTLLLGTTLGLINGILTTFGRLNHFVATLGTSIAFGGAAIAISNGNLLLVEDQNFSKLATTVIAGFQSSTVIFAAFALVCAFLLRRTVFGRYTYATGGNLRAARISGVPVSAVLICNYALSGFAAALAGLIVLSRTTSVTGSTGFSVIFAALAAILIGGNSVAGGEGAIWRTIAGVLILGLIANGFNLLGINPYYQEIVSGVIIVVAVSVDVWVRQART